MKRVFGIKMGHMKIDVGEYCLSVRSSLRSYSVRDIVSLEQIKSKI